MRDRMVLFLFFLLHRNRFSYLVFPRERRRRRHKRRLGLRRHGWCSGCRNRNRNRLRSVLVLIPALRRRGVQVGPLGRRGVYRVPREKLPRLMNRGLARGRCGRD